MDAVTLAAAKAYVKSHYASKGLTTAGAFQATNPMPQIVLGIDTVDDRLFAISGTTLVMSTDRGATYGTDKGVPANVTPSTIKKLLRWTPFGGSAKIFTVGLNTVSGRVELYSADPQPVLNTAFSWSAALLQLTAGSTSAAGFQMNGSNWGDARDAIIVQDYGPDPTGGPSMWRSTDGVTFTKVLGPISATRHFHHIAADPYRPGHWWMTCGDGTGHQFYRSTDYGVTWTKLSTSTGSTADLTAAAWQAVFISFDANSIYFCGDSGYYTVFKMKRSDVDAGTYKPIISPRFHQQLWIPTGRPARGPFADGVLTSGSKTLTSATAAFTSDDVGKLIAFTASINPGGYPSTQPLRIWITAVTNSTTVTLSAQANGSATSVAFLLSGDVLYHGAFWGAVDPATGIVYQLANDTTSSGTRAGLFATYPDGTMTLLESWGPSYSAEVFIYQGYVYCGRMKRPLLTLDTWAS